MDVYFKMGTVTYIENVNVWNIFRWLLNTEMRIWSLGKTQKIIGLCWTGVTAKSDFCIEFFSRNVY
jgi:hypothetical protein